MNNKFIFEVGYSGKSNYSHIEAVTSEPTFYDFLTKNNFKVATWEMCEHTTYVEINADNLPTGKYFMLFKAEKTNEEKTGEFIW